MRLELNMIFKTALLLALGAIIISVTGCGSLDFGFTFTAAHLPSGSVGSVIPATLTSQMPTISSPSRE